LAPCRRVPFGLVGAALRHHTHVEERWSKST
jgi:hypothetical protein